MPGKSTSSITAPFKRTLLHANSTVVPGKVAGRRAVTGHGVENGTFSAVRLPEESYLHDRIRTLTLRARPRPIATERSLVSTKTAPPKGADLRTRSKSPTRIPSWASEIARWRGPQNSNTSTASRPLTQSSDVTRRVSLVPLVVFAIGILLSQAQGVQARQCQLQLNCH